MGVGKPGVHGDESDLRAEADEHEREPRVDERAVEIGAGGGERRVGRGVLVAERRDAGGIDEHDSEQAEGESGRSDHDVLPARLERLVRALAGDEQRADHCGQLNRDPQHAEVGDDRGGQQRQPEQVQKRPVHAAQPHVSDTRLQVADGVDRHHGVDESDRDEEHAAQPVEEERAVERLAAPG